MVAVEVEKEVSNTKEALGFIEQHSFTSFFFFTMSRSSKRKGPWVEWSSKQQTFSTA